MPKTLYQIEDEEALSGPESIICAYENGEPGDWMGYDFTWITFPQIVGSVYARKDITPVAHASGVQKAIIERVIGESDSCTLLALLACYPS